MSFDLGAYMKERAAAVDAALDRFLPAETERPETLHKAMRYSVFAGGKRLRPVLVIAGAEAVGGTAEQVMPTACAMELIHTYSLVHDDLPAMDNDDFRRGVPTNHKVFGEAIAILAGDALLTLAFRLVADNARTEQPRARSQASWWTSPTRRATGAWWRGRSPTWRRRAGRSAPTRWTTSTPTRPAPSSAPRCASAPCSAGRRPRRCARSAWPGADLGLAFQIVDDILDVVASSEELGKTAGKDQIQQKATYPAIHGIEASRARAALPDRARRRRRWPRLGPRAEPIRALGRFILERKA